MNQYKQVWDRFCNRLKIIESGVPLFKQSDDLFVETKTIGIKSIRSIILRSLEMEQIPLSILKLDLTSHLNVYEYMSIEIKYTIPINPTTMSNVILS